MKFDHLSFEEADARAEETLEWILYHPNHSRLKEAWHNLYLLIFRKRALLDKESAISYNTEAH